MNRIAVIGNAGGGKSTLCRKLSRTLGIPSYAIDRIQWKPGWTPASYEEVKREHDHILAQERWIIDGWGSFDLIEARFRAADTIILVDLPLATHYWWTLKRQFACLFTPRKDGPEGCPMLPMTGTLLKMIWNIHQRLRPRLLALCDDFRKEKHVIHVTSPRELQALRETLCSNAQ
ncbi:MAG: flagellar protein FlaR [Anaerolineae bacterium]|nr:flagellar protein FlaR [Anaerolineae bacterium]